MLHVALIRRPIIDSRNIHGLMHDIWPAFQRGYDEKRHHSLLYVVEIRIVTEPLAAFCDALVLVLVVILLDTAVEEVALVSVYCKDCKHEPDYQYDDSDVEN